MKRGAFSESDFDSAWKALDADQRRAFVKDVREVQRDMGKKAMRDERAAIRVLLGRIGGPGAMSDYANVLLASERARAQR